MTPLPVPCCAHLARGGHPPHSLSSPLIPMAGLPDGDWILLQLFLAEKKGNQSNCERCAV